MASIKDDTNNVKEEFEGLSNSTQVFVWSLVGIGVIIGVLIGAIAAVGIVVDEVDGVDCIEYEDELYCAETAAPGDADDADAPDDADNADDADDVEDTDDADDADDTDEPEEGDDG